MFSFCYPVLVRMTERIIYMNVLEKAVQDARADILKNPFWKPSVKEKYYYGVNNLVHYAERNDFDDLSQKLVDSYLNDFSVKRSTLNDRTFFVKIVDRYAGSMLLKPDGRLLNETEFLDSKETADYFAGKVFPVTDADVFYLISYALSLIRNAGLSDSTYGQYVHAYHCLYPLFLKNGKSVFDKAFILELLERNDEASISGKIEQWVHKIRRRCLNILIEVYNSGTLDWHIYKENNESLNTELADLKNEYIHFINTNNLSAKTVSLHDFVFRKTVEYLNVINHEDFINIKREEIEEMMKKFNDCFSQRSMETIIPIIRRIFKFLYGSNYIDANFSGMILSPNHFTEYNPAVLSRSEEKRIIENLKELNLRDQAIMMLAIRYGLRDSDICNLKLEDIDWYADTINITQSKTDEPLSLPLLDDVGNLIMNYIINQRPRCESPYIFLTCFRPFRKLESAYGICSKYFEKLDVKLQSGSGKGIHVFRYSLVKRLLESKVSHQVITDSLGHSSKESDKYYLTLEEDKLRLCCLDARWIGVKSWQ